MDVWIGLAGDGTRRTALGRRVAQGLAPASLPSRELAGVLLQVVAKDILSELAMLHAPYGGQDVEVPSHGPW